MKFIEDDDGNTVQKQIILQHTRQNGFRHNGKARSLRYPRFETHHITCGFPDLLSEQRRNPRCDGKSGNPPRFEHNNFPRKVIEKRERKRSRFSRTRFRRKYERMRAGRFERDADIVQMRCDRQLINKIGINVHAALYSFQTRQSKPFQDIKSIIINNLLF